MSHHGPSRTARLLPRRRRKVIAAALVALAAIVTGGILWAWLAAEARPSGVVVMMPGDPEADLAPVVAWLLGDGAHFVTGLTLSVDGGVWMAP